MGGRDLLKSEKGTWLGLTTDGRIAVLTNFREEVEATTQISRGAMVNAFLTPKPDEVPDTEVFVKRLIKGEGARGSGGFSIVCGRIGRPLAVVSNRMQKEGDVKWIGQGKAETVGLSNAAFGDRSWEKVVHGEEQMKALIERSVRTNAQKDEIIENLLDLLSLDTLPKRTENEDWVSFVRQLRKSIFVPKVSSDGQTEAQAIAAAKSDAKILESKETSGAYGTQKQSIVLVHKDGTITFVEKTLYDAQERRIRDDAQSVRRFEIRTEN